jgi:hypothetical protein
VRYRLMASYRGTPYQAGVGPSDSEVTLLAAWPPPEEHGFVSSGSHWRKQVRIDDVEALWESRPVGSYHGDPCLVLDDLGDRLHIAYLGMDSTRASQLGYWQVDRGVFEVVIPRTEVVDLAEERHEFSLTALMFTPDPPASRMLAPALPPPERPAPPALDRAYPALERPAPPMDRPAPALPALERPMLAAERPAPARPMPALERPLPPAPERPLPAAERPLPPFERPAPPAEYPMPAPERPLPPAERPLPAGATAWHGSPAEEDGAWPRYPRPDDPGSPNGNGSAAHNGTGGFKALGWADPFPEPAGFPDRAATPMDLHSPQAAEPLAPLSAPLPAEPQVAEPQVAEPQVTGPPADRSGAPEMVRGRRAARKPRVSTQSVFAELLDLAQIPRSSYAVDEEVSGAMCLTKITGGFEVFSCTDDARHEVRFFEDEEAAYFYLFGVLAADAVRSGSLTPRSSLSILLNTQSEATSHDISENLREYARYAIPLARDA